MSYRNPVRAVTATLAAGAGSSIRVRTTSQGGGNQFSAIQLVVPTSVVAGDLLVVFAVPPSGGNVGGTPAGFTNTLIPGAGGTRMYTKTAVASDAGKTLTGWTSTDNNTTYLGMFALVGATTATLIGYSATQPIATGTRASGAFFFAMSFGNTVPNWGWAAAVQGGPPNPPGWSAVAFNDGLAGAVSVANWTPADSYNALPAGSGVLCLAT